MKLGLLTAILDTSSFEEVLEIASQIGYECLEVACWPKETATRRYAGVTHINVSEITEEELNKIKLLCQKYNIEISALAYYPNVITDDLSKRSTHVNHLKSMIELAPKLGVSTITTFIGRVQSLSTEENLKIVQEVWPPIVQLAEENNVKIAIENCPMLFGQDQWPGGQNIMSTPAIWREVFKMIPSDNLGLNYDPSHFIWQGIDYIKPLYEFKDKIFHVHYKDIKLYKDKLNDVGTMGYPLDYMSPKLPGLGDVNWSSFVSALRDIGYDGYTCIEIEDKSFEDSDKKILDSLKLSYNYMKQFVI